MIERRASRSGPEPPRLIVPVETKRRLVRRLRRQHVHVADHVIDALVDYYSLLLRWNTKINLTGLVDGDEAVDRLLVEPLIAARNWPDPGRLTVDLGSGSGSPAVPLKIALPDLEVRLVEAKARKSAFLREVVRHLGLQETSVETSRIEAVAARPEFAGRADVVTMRAVRSSESVLEAVAALLRAGGQFLLFARVGASAAQAWPPDLELLGEAVLVPDLQSALVRFRRL